MTRSLTRKGEQTRDRIVAGAAADVRERGVDEVRLEDVMARTGTSKSQLFHYFPGGKEDLLLAVARHEADQVLADQQPMLGDLSSWPVWDAWRDRLISRYEEQGMTCPLNGLLGQAGRRAPAAQAVVTGMMRSWEQAIVAGVRRMQAAGQIAAELDAGQVAASLLAGIQGGVVMLTATGSIDYLKAAVDVGLANLRPGPPAA